MDGSTVVIPSAKPPAGLAREDALFRIVYYGEALRGMTEHVSDSLISGPCVPMIELLDEAFDTLSSKRDSFGPEEFTLFVMSKMLGLCDDADEARQFQVGAAQYILKSAEALPDTYKSVIDDARKMLRRSALSDNTGNVVQDQPEAPAIAPPTATTTAAPATDTAAPPLTDVPRERVRVPSLERASQSPSMRPARRVRYASGTPRDRGFFKLFERAIIAGLIAFAVGLLLMTLLGLFDPANLIGPVPDAPAPFRP